MRFSLVTFDDEAVVFDAASGDTHYLSPLSLALLRILQTDPALDPAALRERVSASYDIDPAMPLDPSIQDALGRLRATGILPDA
mgnify:CR=1 FL=1